VENAGSVTEWLVQIQEGDPEAARVLWERYFQQLAAVVRGQLAPRARAAADESDVALSAFHSFFRDVQDGRFPNLQGRDQLWRVLVVIARRKAVSWLRHEYAQRRGGGKVEGNLLLSEIAGSEPTPELAATLLDEVQHLLELLRAEDPMLALIATRKCEGFSNHEIAAELSVSVRTIERKLLRIDILMSEDIERRFGEKE
jgi:DNA-directed RNA polymerase specialized sigma24 family protein